MSYTRMTTEQREQIASLARAGCTLPEIARRMERSKSTVRYALRSLGVSAKPARAQLTAEIAQRIVELYAELGNKNEVARRLGIDPGMVRRRLRALCPPRIIDCTKPTCRRENCSTNPAKFGHRFDEDLRCVECGIEHAAWRQSPTVCRRFDSLEQADRADRARRDSFVEAGEGA